MKRPTFLNNVLVALVLLLSVQLFAQNYVPFTPRFDQDLKGDILLIGNNILGPDNNAYNNNNQYNHRVNMRYIDIDGDPSTFSSSSADLVIPNPLCYKIAYAGLYWGAVTNGPQSITNVKFKGPSGGYNDVVGTIIYDAAGVATGSSFPYSCYADVTAIVTGLATNSGTYTVGNVSSAEGRTDQFNPYNGTGYSAGWSLFIVYEDPTLPSKSITSFDGFSAISSSVNLNIPISGFRTVPAPAPVRANFAFAALEGDKPIQNDRLRLNGVSLSSTDRPANNFFNSSVTQLSGLPVNNRNPNSTNTLGFDTGILNVPNPGNTVIANDATSATVRLESNQDAYFEYFFALAVEIIEPKIVLTKIVEDEFGNDIGGQNVTLGQQLNYVIGFQNTGNDHATNMTIRDVLPINTLFNYPADMDILPPGVTVQSYNPVTREIIFQIDDSVIEIDDPVLEIRFKVQVVPSCNMLSDACSNSIDNQAYTTYAGVFNPTFAITDDPSLNTNTGCLLVPKATNFLVGVDDCQFASTEVLCGDSVLLTAANGYSSYSWSSDPSGTPVIGTTQSITVTSVGTYYVRNTAIAPCLSIDQEITVVPFGSTTNNPIIPFADEVVICPNDGKELPNIFLCGANASRVIQTGITDTSSIIWEKLDESSCSAVVNTDCANENSSCTWNQVGSGPDYTANASGQYRVVLNYAGGCFNRYYFNVYQNLLSPTVTTTDIICNTPGQITVGGIPNGYEYSLDNITYQASNIFTINTQNIYTVYIRQAGVSSNPCIFTVPNIQIRARNFTVSTIITPPLCNGGKGSVKLAANDVRPQYFYSIYSGATLINSTGLIVQSDYTFANLNPGTYTVNVGTEDGCAYTADIVIIDPPLLTATSAITQPLTCTDGEITVYPVGGTPPYFYFVNSTTVFQSVPEVVVTAPGLYDITVVDSNNCSTTTSITVTATPPPVFNITKVDVLCANSGNTGSINVNVTNANGNSLRYSIDNGATFVNSPIFNGLAAGSYDVVVEYTFSSDVCITAPQTITINASTAITGTATLTTPYTCITNGTITVSGVSGGNGPYTYSIDGVTFQAGNTFSGLTNGNYTVTIKDSNNCTINTNSISIAPLNPPTDLSFSNSALTCPTNVSTVTITGTTGGVGTLEYRIVAPAGSVTAYQSSTIFTGLAPDTYTFEVKDANDCTYTESYTIMPLPALTVVGQKINDITCFGASDGAARFTVAGSTGFTYTINGGASIAGTSPINLTGLAAATYTIVITDTTTNCQATASVTIDSPAAALSLTTTVTPITCNANGSVVINATGGWGGNSYTLTQPDTTVLPAQGSNTFSNLSQSGTYTATVTDSKGCVQTITFNLSTPTAPTASIAITSDYCFDPINGATLEVTAAGGITPYEYNINGGPFGASNIFSNLTPGNYTIIVRDAYGCTVTLPAQTIAPQVTVTTVLTKELDCTVSPDAVITGTITGGYSPFTYAVSINGAAYSSLGATGSPFVYTTATDGTYQFQITDARGCQTESNVITISPITNPVVTGTPTNVSCNGVSDGSVQLVGSGGSGGYTYSDDNVTFVGTSLFTGLAAGSHTFYIKDSKNCTSSVTVVITEPTVLVATASATAFSCSVTNTKQSATITIAVPTTGTAPYQYSFNGGATFSSTRTLTVNDNGLDQTFSYVVRDANGCLTAAQNITLTRLDPPTDLTFASTAVTCLATSSTVTLTATDGVGPLEYETIAPSPIIVAKQASNVFTLLTPGTYVFRVTDANGCYYTESYIVNPVTPIAVTGLKLSDVLCFGDNTGAIQYTVSGYAGTYTSVLTSGAGVLVQAGNTVNLTGLIADTYTLEVTDDITGCTADATIIITEPTNALTFTATSTNVYCTEDNSQITVTPAGGTPSYTYAAVVTGNPAPALGAYASSSVITVDTNSATDLVWDVYVQDANGCITMTPVTILSDALPTVTTPPLASNQCTVTTGFTFTATGTGLGPLEYSINGGASYQASPTFIVNVPGTYFVTIKDKNGCTAISPTPTIIYPPLTSLAAVTKELDCSASPDAVITVTISGGFAPYTYTVQKGAGVPSAPSGLIAGPTFTYSVSLANADSYTFEITDSNSCTSTTTIAVDPITNPVVTGTPTNVSCNGVSDGSVQLVGSGGSGGYTYSDDNVTFVGTSLFTGLAAGSHTFYIKDSKNCTSSVTVVITEPTALVATATATDLSCSVTNTKQSAEITIAVPMTGTAPYQYSFDGGANFSSANTLTVNDNGANQTFSYVVKDANGCTDGGSVTVVALDPPTDLAFSSAAVTCLATTTDVTLTTPTGGVGALSYTIISPASATGNVSGASTGIFTNLAPDTYVFRVTDANGCYYSESYTINPVTPITITGLKLSDVLCYGESTGAIQYTVSGYAGTYTSVLTSGAGTLVQAGSTVDLTGLIADTYTLEVTDDITGCTADATIIITEPTNALTLIETTNINANCFARAQVSVTASGGTPSYTYAFVQDLVAPIATDYTSSNSAVLDPIVNVNWDVWVMDANGCTFKIDVAIATDPVPTIDPVALQCYIGTPFNITLAGTGVAPLTYSIGGSYQVSPTFTISAAGTYNVSIKDGNGCIASTTYVVQPELLLDANMSQELTCLLDASITLTPSGGTGIYTSYEVDFNSGGYVAIAGSPYTTNIAGTYQFRVTDDQGCQAESNIIIVDPAIPVTASFVSVDPTCNGYNDGSITLTALTGEAPFTYSLDGGTTFVSSNVFGGLVAGNYDYVVRDSKDCQTSATITLNDPAPIVPNIVVNGIQCGPVTPGSFDVQVTSGGTAPYIYTLFDNSFTQIATYTEVSSASTPVYNFGGLTFGDYYITIVDANGCEYKSAKLRIEPAPYLNLTSAIATASCATGVDVVLNVSGGVPNYTYSIFGQPLSVFGPTPSVTHTFTGLDQGTTYVFEVIDVNGCPSYLEIITPIISPIVIDPIVATNVTCNGADNGEITFTVDQYNLSTTDLYYEVRDNLTNTPIVPAVNGHLTGLTGLPANGTITGLPAGNYTLYVKEFDGITLCSTTRQFQITEPIQALTSTITAEINANCNSGALLTLTTTGGTGPYQYAAGAPGFVPVAADFGPSNVLNLDYAVRTNWDIVIEDANGCQFRINKTITEDPSPTVTTPPVASNQCTVSSGFTFTATGASGVPPYVYSINGGASYQASPTFIVNVPGTYFVTIKDANGCTDISPTPTIVYAPLTSVSAVTKELDCTVSPNAVITVTISGGNAPYTYTVQKGAGVPSAPSGPIAGPTFTYSVSLANVDSYTFEITDTNGCTSTTTIAVDPITNPTFTFTQTNVTCNGGSDGSIVVTAASGTAPYQYSMDNGVTFQASNVFNGLSAGPYNVVVMDSKSCVSPATLVTITEPVIVGGTGVLTQGLTCGAGNATQAAIVTITGSGGTAPYTYSFDGGVNYTLTNTYTTFSSGPVTAYVKDANGCIIPAAITVNVPALDPPTDLDFSSAPVTCIATTTDVTLTTTNGVGPLSYAIISPASATGNVSGDASGTYTGLAPDTYVFEVTDANFCTYQESYTVDPVTNITVSGTLVNDVSCNGGSNGAVDFTVTNFAGTYSYTINGGPAVVGQSAATISLTGLPIGNQTIVVTDETTGCTATVTITVSEPTALTLVENPSINANCNFGAQVSVTAGGGTPNYTYAFVQNGFAPIASDYTASASAVLDPAANTDWDVWVMDANGCTTQIDVVIATDPLPTINPVAPQCFTGSSFTITLVEGTGTAIGPVTYSIGTGGVAGAYQSSDTFTISAAGTYNLFIKDGNGCIVTTTYVVQPPLLLDANMTQDLTCIIDANIVLTPSGGTGVYTTYEVSTDGGTTYSVIAGSPYTATVDGTYQFRVTDSQGCQSESNVIIVTPKTAPTLMFTQTNVTCNGGSDGSIVVTASNGIAPYQYSIDNGVTFQASNVFNGLNAAGVYNVVVMDSKSCVSPATLVTITEPALVGGTIVLTQGLTCGAGNATQAAIVTVTGSGGTAPYTYSFDGGVNYTATNTYTTFSSGLVTAYVKDANGCIIPAAITIPVPALDPPTDLDFSSAPVTCIATTTDVTLTTTNGVGPLSYAIISPASATGNVSGDASGTYTGLAPDTYVFEVTDANFCTYQESYTVDPVTNITVSGTLVNDVSCNGGSNGAVDFTVTNFAGTYSYTINGVPTGAGVSTLTISLTGLPIGNQTIVVTDDITGCTATDVILVSEPTVLTLVETTNINANCNFGAQVSVTAGGGTPNYTYAFVQDLVAPIAADYTASNSAVLDPTVNVNWDVWVMDANGCTTQIDVVIATDPLPTVTVPAFASNQCNLTGTPYTFAITGSSGIAPLTYSIGTGFQSSGTFTGLAPGNYFVTVKDGNGCTAVSPTSVTIYAPLDLTPTITALPTCAINDGEITVTGSGGTGNYSYEITSGPILVGSQISNIFSGLPAGTYTITITDTTTLCTKDVDVTLSAATPVTFTTSVNNVSCNGGNDGIITVNLPVSNDNPIYTYEITAGPLVFGSQNSNIFTGLVAGNYTVQVNSGRGCSATEIVPVTEPTPLTISGIATDFSCAPNNSVNTSTLTISEGGGTSPYTYSIDGTNYLSSNIFDIIDTGVTQNIDIYVKDANGCIAFNTVSILPLPTLTGTTVAIVTPIDCNNTGSVVITVSGGSGNFSYQMLPSGTPQASNIFSITVPGDYYFQVNDLTTGCTIATSVFTVAPFNLIDVVASPATPVTCFGDTNGALAINVSGYAGPYNYEVFDNLGVSILTGSGNTLLNPQPITGLSGGNYTVLVTETASPFCAVTSNVITIASPSDPLALIATETASVTCTNDKGTITALASGGWGNFEYELTGAATVPYSPNGTFTNLSAGVYTINVRDSGGCIVSQNVTLVIPAPIAATVTPSTNVLTCFGDTNASITVSGVIGGEGSNYSYTLITIFPSVSTSGPQASPVFSGLGAGTYNVVITDGYNCSFTSGNIVITQPTKVQSTLVKSSSQTCLTGTTLTLSAVGGTGPYTYSATASFTPVLGSFASSTTINVTPGTYVYYVKDVNGCVANISNQIKIDPLPPLVVNVDSTNAFINCAGDNTGVIVATAQGGLGGYIYTLQDTLGNPIPAVQNSPGRFTDLFAGTYQVQVDSGDCTITSSVVTISEPALPLTASYSTTDVTCNGSNNGILQISASGGTGIIKYAISPQLNQFFETSTFDNLAPGIYDVIVQDELGCFVYFPVSITEPSPLALSIVPGSLIPEVCSGDMDGEFSIDISGGTAPYSVSLDDINGVYTIGILGQTQFDFTGLAGGDHIVYVMDGQGCETEWNITFPESVTINPEAIVDYSCINNMSANTVTVTIDASITNPSDIDYSLDGGTYQPSNVFTNVIPGTNHVIDVRHTNGCIKTTAPFDILQIDPLSIGINDGGLNEIVAVTTGGSGVYEYALNGESYGSTSSFIIYSSGNYTVTVTDSNGCTAEASRYFEYIDICVPNYFTPNSDGVSDSWAPGCTINYKDLVFSIFDRYGRKIATYRLGETWDGTYNGAELPSGDYWYVIKLNDKKDDREFVGHFTLYR